MTNFSHIPWAHWAHPANHEPKDMGQVWGPMVEAWRPYIKPGDHCLDIGAYTGDTTVPMAVLAGPAGRVIAFEPNSAVFPTLQKNCITLPNTCAQVIPVRLAADSFDNDVEFCYSDAEFCNGGQLLPTRDYKIKHRIPQIVRATDLRAFITPLTQFIKIDTEGNDHRILSHIATELKQWHPTIQAEVYPDLTAQERINFLAFLHDLGYRTVHLNGDPFTQVHVVCYQLCDFIATTCPL